jgi:hypothetical protein
MARLPNHPYLMTLYSYFIVEVRHDTSAARTQLQLASKSGPSLLDRYFIYIGNEVIRNIKSDSKLSHASRLMRCCNKKFSYIHIHRFVLVCFIIAASNVLLLSPSRKKTVHAQEIANYGHPAIKHAQVSR